MVILHMEIVLVLHWIIKKILNLSNINTAQISFTIILIKSVSVLRTLVVMLQSGIRKSQLKLPNFTIQSYHHQVCQKQLPVPWEKICLLLVTIHIDNLVISPSKLKLQQAFHQTLPPLIYLEMVLTLDLINKFNLLNNNTPHQTNWLCTGTILKLKRLVLVIYPMLTRMLILKISKLVTKTLRCPVLL